MVGIFHFHVGFPGKKNTPKVEFMLHLKMIRFFQVRSVHLLFLVWCPIWTTWKTTEPTTQGVKTSLTSTGGLWTCTSNCWRRGFFLGQGDVWESAEGTTRTKNLHPLQLVNLHPLCLVFLPLTYHPPEIRAQEVAITIHSVFWAIQSHIPQWVMSSFSDGPLPEPPLPLCWMSCLTCFFSAESILGIRGFWWEVER